MLGPYAGTNDSKHKYRVKYGTRTCHRLKEWTTTFVCVEVTNIKTMVARIAEIQEQDTSLRVLVAVVAIGVFLFGVITVFSVLVDSTDRKKGMIGILRVMGISGPGVFFILLARAVIIGVMAAAVCCGIGVLLAALLGKTIAGAEYLAWLPQVRVVLGPSEYLLVTAGAILCAAFGVLMPAVKASRLDPFDAIMEGQFH